MNDHEYAALAAGYKVKLEIIEGEELAMRQHEGRDYWVEFNPLNNGTDAFSLMADTRIKARTYNDDSAGAFWAKGMGEDHVAVISGPDRYANLRKAIFDCAVKLGKQLHSQQESEG